MKQFHDGQGNVFAETGAPHLEADTIIHKRARGSRLLAIAAFSGIPT